MSPAIPRVFEVEKMLRVSQKPKDLPSIFHYRPAATMSTRVTLLNGTYGKYADALDPDSLHRLDGLFAYYHRQWWYRRQMFYKYKWYHGLLNGLALLAVGLSVVVGAVWNDSFVMIGLTAFGTVVKGWNEFKNFAIKMDMCHFAYTTHEKTLIELRTYVRGLTLDEFDGFLIKLQTMDDTITDLTPPTYDGLVKQYEKKFEYVPIPPREHKLKVSSV